MIHGALLPRHRLICLRMRFPLPHTDSLLALFRLSLVIVLLALPAALTTAGPALAQANAIDAINQTSRDITATARILDRLSSAAGKDDESLVGARVKYQNLIGEANELIRRIDEQSKTIADRLTEIGPPPEDDNIVEPSTVIETRAQLNKEKAELAVLKTNLENLVHSAQDSVSRITQTRQEAFTEAISKHTAITPGTIGEAIDGIKSLAASAKSQFANWFAFVAKDKAWQAIGSAFISLAFALFLSVSFNRVFGSYLLHRLPHPDYFTRVFTAFWATVLPSLATAVFLAATYALFRYFGVLPDNIARIMLALIIAIAGLVFAFNLCRAVYAPRNPTWRLVALTDVSARRMFALTLILFIIHAFDSVFTEFNAALSGPVTLTALQGLLASLTIGITLAAMGLVIRPQRKIEEAESAEQDQASQGEPPSLFKSALAPLFRGTRIFKLVRFLLFLSAAIIIVSALLGYIGFARFTAQQLVVSGAIIAAMLIGIQAAREVSREGVLAKTRFGRLMRQRGVEDFRIEQFSLVAGIALMLTILMIGIPAILMQWGTRYEELTAFGTRLFTGIDVGNIRISLSGILIGLTIFALILLATRFFQRWLSRSVFTRSKIDAGVRDSISAGIGYTGFAIAALLAVTSAGFDLSSLAIVAGALSLGIGFGLQNIVNNFVSGLILLVERPIKVGDWIVVGAAEGTVRRISVRATEIETFQRQSIIVPNSELINSQVGNWTFKSKSGRVDVPVGIAYGSDVRLAEKILYEIAHEHAMVAKKPEPSVWFVGFGDFSLDFRLRMFLYDINNLVTVESEVRFAILERFEEAGIEIPFPQRNLNLRIEGDHPNGSELAKALAETAESEGPNKPAKRPARKPSARKPANEPTGSKQTTAKRTRRSKTQPG